MTPSLISYTLPCHKREADLETVLQSVIDAAVVSPPVAVLIADYGCHPQLGISFQRPGVSVRTVRVEADHFHMAHARNVGIKAAQGDIIVAFLADQFVGPQFFTEVRKAMRPGMFLKWIETFAFWRDDILAAGGFDERFEFYGPEGKELSERLQRRGLTVERFPAACGIDQIKTQDSKKLAHYRVPLSKRAMHERGLAIWQENRDRNLLVANPDGWGRLEVPVYA